MSEENKQPLEQEEVTETPEAQVEQEAAQDEEKAEKKAKKKKVLQTEVFLMWKVSGISSIQWM